MIEIKQENNVLKLYSCTAVNQPEALFSMPILKSDIPNLISRLIELGGVAVKWPDIRSEWHPVECPSIFKHLLENYHLIPKDDKKEAE